MDPRVLNVGDTIEYSTVGAGVITGFYHSYPMVDGKAVGNLTRTDGAKFGVGGSLALPSAVAPTPVPVAPVGGTMFGSHPHAVVAAAGDPGSMPITTPESPRPMTTPEQTPVEPLVVPVEPVEPAPETEVQPLSTTNDGEALVPDVAPQVSFGVPPNPDYIGMTPAQLQAAMAADSQPVVPAETAIVQPPGSMEGETVVGVETFEPSVEHDEPPHVSPPDPSQATVGEPLVAPAKSPDHGDESE